MAATLDSSASASYCSSTERIQSKCADAAVSARFLCLSCKGNVHPTEEWMFPIEDDHFNRSHSGKPEPAHYKSPSVKRIYGRLGKKVFLD